MKTVIIALLAVLAVALASLDNVALSNGTRRTIEWGAFACLVVIMAALSSFV
jgi:hypothetical protein